MHSFSDILIKLAANSCNKSRSYPRGWGNGAASPEIWRPG